MTKEQMTKEQMTAWFEKMLDSLAPLKRSIEDFARCVKGIGLVRCKRCRTSRLKSMVHSKDECLLAEVMLS